MQAILKAEQEEDEEGEEEEVFDDREVNEAFARTEEELKLFNEMDE